MSGLKSKRWAQVSWLPDYEISEDGMLRRHTAGRTRLAGHMPKGHLSQGYRHYKVVVADGTKKIVKAHILVCEAFNGARPPGAQVAHGDGDRLNNHYSNLRWATSKENHQDRVSHGTSGRGTDNVRARLTDDDVRTIRQKFSGKRGQISSLAKEYGMSHSAMSSVCNGESWSHVRS